MFPGVRAVAEPDLGVAALKADVRMARVVARAVKTRQRGVRETVRVPYGRFVLKLSADAITTIVDEVRTLAGTHNERRRFVESRPHRRTARRVHPSQHGDGRSHARPRPRPHASRAALDPRVHHASPAHLAETDPASAVARPVRFAGLDQGGLRVPPRPCRASPALPPPVRLRRRRRLDRRRHPAAARGVRAPRARFPAPARPPTRSPRTSRPSSTACSTACGRAWNWRWTR